MAMTPVERLESVFAEAGERCRAAGLPEPSLEEIVARCESAGEGCIAEKCPYCNGGELVTSWDPIPTEDGEDEELAELYAHGVEHTACTRCGFVGFTPTQVHELQKQLAGERSRLDELYASGVEHQVCPNCGFVTFTEAQANEIHREYWRDRRQP